MIDLQLLRQTPDVLDAALARRGQPAQAAALIALDQANRAIVAELQQLQTRRNELSRQVGELKKQGQDAAAIMAEVAALKEQMAAREADAAKAAQDLQEAMSRVPNLPAAEVPTGKDEHDNQEIVRWGDERKKTGGNFKQHFELGEALGLMDFAAATKLSGARFTVLKGGLARLERALGNFMLDIHTREFGYTEISPPLLVNTEIMYGTGQLPKFAEDQFVAAPASLTYHQQLEIMSVLEEMDKKQGTTNFVRVPNLNGLDEKVLTADGVKEYIRLKQMHFGKWLIPTAEVPLTNLVNDSIVEAAELPLRLTAKTPCFRAEAGAAGRDTRGMLRQHQFYKVELVSITTPNQSAAEHERMTSCAETILQQLELPYRKMLLCSGDMGFAATKTYDLEVWLPGQQTYREISSCSNCGDFQARRMKARYREPGKKDTQFLHTLNGSGVAVGRCLIAILENHQQPDGSVAIPAALQPYFDGQTSLGLTSRSAS